MHAQNDAPLANAQSVQVDAGDSLAITLSGSDIDGDPLSYSVSSGPSNGNLSGTAPNLTYTPNGGFSGSDSFGFVANDEGKAITLLLTKRSRFPRK